MEMVKTIINSFEFQTIIKLLLGIFLAGIIGLERSSWSKPAGFRTHALVGISAVLVMICGEYMSKSFGVDSSRIPAQLLSGIGFLGAGTILRDGFNVKGLTTASTLLAVTCIGLCIGAGYYLCGIIATALVYIILSYSYLISDKIEHYNMLELEIELEKQSQETLKQIKKMLEDNDIIVTELDMSKYKNNIIKIIGKDKKKSEHSFVTDLISFDNVINYADIAKDAGMIEIEKPEMEIYDEYSKEDVIKMELKTLGFYLSLHPASKYRKDYIVTSMNIKDYFDKNIKMALLISNIRETTTKNNDVMAFVVGSDEYGDVSLTIFPNVYSRFNNIKINDIIEISGRVERRFDKYQIVVNSIKILE